MHLVMAQFNSARFCSLLLTTVMFSFFFFLFIGILFDSDDSVVELLGQILAHNNCASVLVCSFSDLICGTPFLELLI